MNVILRGYHWNRRRRHVEKNFHVFIPGLLQAFRHYEFGLLLVLFSFDVLTLSLIYRIVHYEQRLKSLFTKKRFPERMGEVKPRVQGMLRMS